MVLAGLPPSHLNMQRPWGRHRSGLRNRKATDGTPTSSEEGGQLLEAGRGTSGWTWGYTVAFWLSSHNSFMLLESLKDGKK